MGRYFSEEFKLKVVKEYYSGSGMSQLERRYNIRHKRIQDWVKKYNEFGGFPDFRGKGSKGRPKRIDIKQMTPDEYIQHLKMENDILKKLRSLNNNQVR
ncbi:MAG: transposase [Clostridia bacterium]|nr:transposase [Clostridia bacterium]